MFSILNRALSWAITSSGNKFCLKKRSRLIKALNNRFYVKFMQLEIGLLLIKGSQTKNLKSLIIDNFFSCYLMVMKLCAVIELGMHSGN